MYPNLLFSVLFACLESFTPFRSTRFIKAGSAPCAYLIYLISHYLEMMSTIYLHVSIFISIAGETTKEEDEASEARHQSPGEGLGDQIPRGDL